MFPVCWYITTESTCSAIALSGRVNLGKRKRNTAISVIQENVARALNVINVMPEEINVDTSTTENY